MKLRLITTACIMFAALAATQAKDYKYQTVDGDLMKARVYTLDNGLKVYLSVNKDAPRIQTYIAVRTGSRNDPAETTGLAHYLEHLMFKGTKTFGTSDYAKEAPLLDSIKYRFEQYRKLTDPQQRKAYYHEIDSISQLAAKYFIPNEYDKLMASIGSQGTNAFTSNDVTCYVENIPSNEVENWLKVQSDRFQNMVIRGFHTELEAVYEEKNISLARDIWKEMDALYAMLYPTHPYGTQTTLGTQEHLKNPSIVNIMNYFKRYYVPNNTAVCMAGDFDPDKVIALIDANLGGWKKSDNLSRPEFPALPPMTSIRDTTILGQEAEQMMMGWRFNGGADMQADTLDVISKMLYNGKAGMMETDLFQKMKTGNIGVMPDKLTDYTGLTIIAEPKDNQTLEELRGLIMGEIGKLKTGDFPDDLLPAVISNIKKDYYKSLQDNENRAYEFMETFVNSRPWAEEATRISRMEKITKQQIVDFARKYLNDNYACVYKKIGNDTTIKKIDKPQITAIPTNRDISSKFLTEIKNAKTDPIQPRFLNFSKDLTQTKTKKGIPVLYKHNTEDGLFDLAFRYDFGLEDVDGIDIAADYLNFIGTDKKTSAQIKLEFYKLACDYSVDVESNSITVSLSGLSDNMPKALALMEDFMQNVKGDKDSYDKYISLLEKKRADNKTNQDYNFAYLKYYGMYGSNNFMRTTMSEKELRESDPQMLPDMIKKLGTMEHTVMYYGPDTEKQLLTLIAKEHKTAKKLSPVPAGKEYTEELTPKNEIMMAPYDAKNIYMIQYHNEGRTWNPEEQAIESLFNEYFGGGMNTVVFQELREARGLAYSAYATYDSPDRKGHPEKFYTYIVSQNDKMMDCIRVFNNILDTVPQSQAAFDIAKQSLTKQLQSGRTIRFDILNAYMDAKERGIDYDMNEKIYTTLPSLTLADVVRFEQQNMANKPFRYIILGDEKNLDMKSLEKIAPIKRLSTDEIFGY